MNIMRMIEGQVASLNLHGKISIPQHIRGHRLLIKFCLGIIAASVDKTKSYGSQMVKL